MKRAFIAILTLLIIITGITSFPVCAAANLSATASSSSVTIGKSVDVTLKYNTGNDAFGSLDVNFNYNVQTFQFVSATAGTGSLQYNKNAAGLVGISWTASKDAVSSVEITLQFNAIAAGDGKFSVETIGIYKDDFAGTLIGNPSKTLSVTATNPTLSANANLASIKPSSGTLTPKFSANVTNYTISVPYTTTSLSLSVTTQDKGAKTSVSGKNALAVGKNTQVITVTAPNGTTKKYTVVINRSANQTTTTNGTGTTTTTAPQEDPLEVEVGGVMMTVSDTQPDATLPDGYQWTHITINNITVSAAVNETTNLTLVYLIDPQSEAAAFYIYDEVAETFAPFHPLKVSGGDYILREMPAGLIPPARAAKGVYTFGTTEHTVYQFEDTALEDIVLVYATSPAGKTGLFAYDKTDGSMQLYREITVAADSTPQPTEPLQDNAFVGFVKQHRSLILIGAAVLGGIALLTVAIVLIVASTRKGKNCKH